jgi:choline dehydrogenase
MRFLEAFAVGASIFGVVKALPSRAEVLAKRQVTELRREYDFIIVGGGTTGLTVAHRVADAFPESESRNPLRPEDLGQPLTNEN